MSKKLVNEPIFVNNINELNDAIITFNRHQKVKFNCSKCGKEYVVSIDAILKREIILYCNKCIGHATSLKRFGVEHHLKLESQRNKQKATNLKKYGSERPWSFSSDNYKNLIKDKYGVDNVFQSEEIKQKIKETCIKKYGSTTCARNKNVRAKCKQTCLERYGVENTFQSKELMKDALSKKSNSCNGSCFGKRYIFNEVRFDSSWELKMYIYLRDHNIHFEYQTKPIPYVYEGVEHLYFPDFILPCGIVEIKGNQFIKKDGSLYNPYNHKYNGIFLAKQKCMRDNNVIVLSKSDLKPIFTYVDNKYGKDYVKQFRNK